MAKQNSGNTQQRQKGPQASNRGQRAAQERELQAQMEREGRQQTIIGIIATVIIVALIAVGAFFIYKSHNQSDNSTSSMKEALSAVEKVKVKPTGANKQGGFLISHKGLNEPIPGVPTVEIYMDFMCPGCASLNRTLDPTLNKMLKAEQVNLVIYPMSFMDRFTTDAYSSRASSAGIYILEHDTEHFMPYMANLFASDFQPDETDYSPVSDAMLKEQMIKAGVDKQVADQALGNRYRDWLEKMNEYTPLRQELWNTSGSSKGSMTTPTVLINSHFWPTTAPSQAGLDQVEGFLKAIGLPAQEVGQVGKLPSIGSQKAPIALTASSQKK